VHALFRSARYEALPCSRRLLLHQRVAHTLAGRAADDRVILDLARHAFAALPLGNAHLAIDACRRAGDFVSRCLGFDEAARYYRNALDVASGIESRDDALCCELAIRLGEALTFAGDAEGRAVLEQAATSARRLRASELLATASWALSQFGLGFLGLFDPFVASAAEEALAGLGPEPTATRARLLLVLAAEYAGSLDHHQRRQALWAEALAVARQLDDPVTLAHVLAAYQW